MKPQRLSEIRALLGSSDFLNWWEELVRVGQIRDEARERHEELLSQAILMDFRAELTQKNAIDTLYRSSDWEDSAVQLTAECQALENQSLTAVADFEQQRCRAGECWYRVCIADRQVELIKENIEDRTAKLVSVSQDVKADIEGEIRRLTAELHRMQQAQAEAMLRNEHELAEKSRSWDKVEKIWSRSAELSLLVAEKRVQGKKVRLDAERLLKQAEERKQRGDHLRLEAQQAAQERENSEVQVQASLQKACKQFECAQGEDFLYFGQKENSRKAWCIGLVVDEQNYNIRVRPLDVYSIDQKQGVEVLERTSEENSLTAEGDRRFEEYFLQGRKGRVRNESTELKPA